VDLQIATKNTATSGLLLFHLSKLCSLWSFSRLFILTDFNFFQYCVNLWCCIAAALRLWTLLVTRCGFHVNLCARTSVDGVLRWQFHWHCPTRPDATKLFCRVTSRCVGGVSWVLVAPYNRCGTFSLWPQLFSLARVYSLTLACTLCYQATISSRFH